jgi:hypothetical protein
MWGPLCGTQVLRVFVEKLGKRIVVPLAEKVRFADGVVGERRVKSDDRLREWKQATEKRCQGPEL